MAVHGLCPATLDNADKWLVQAQQSAFQWLINVCI